VGFRRGGRDLFCGALCLRVRLIVTNAALAEAREHPLCNLPDCTAGVWGLARQDSACQDQNALRAQRARYAGHTEKTEH
jgi:hypothetical protein